MASIESIETLLPQVRRDILRMVHQVNSGHPGGSLGCAEFFVALYQHVMDYSTAFSMDGKNEDLFFLSNGHISPVFYSVLARSGFFPVSELATFRKLNSRLQGHPTTHTRRRRAPRRTKLGSHLVCRRQGNRQSYFDH